MRLHEIFDGDNLVVPVSESDINALMRERIKSVLVPLRAQKIEKITVKQLMDIITPDDDFQGIDFDQKFIIDILGKSNSINRIQADPENNGEMTIYFEFPRGERQVSADQAEKEKEQIRKAALRQIKDKNK